MSDTISDGIREILAEHGRLRVDVAKLGDADDLYAAGLGSHASVSVMLACEDTWDVEFPNDLMKRETFASIDSIRRALLTLVDAQ